MTSGTGGPRGTVFVLKVTAPVGTFVAGGTGLTVAVKVTFVPGKDGFGADDTSVVVAIGTTMTRLIWLSEGHLVKRSAQQGNDRVLMTSAETYCSPILIE